MISMNQYAANDGTGVCKLLGKCLLNQLEVVIAKENMEL